MVDGAQKTRFYRYRTPALTGRWHDTRERAIAEAVVGALEGDDTRLAGGKQRCSQCRFDRLEA